MAHFAVIDTSFSNVKGELLACLIWSLGCVSFPVNGLILLDGVM